MTSTDDVAGDLPVSGGLVVPAAALSVLRILMGFGIAYNALTEKLLNPPLSQALPCFGCVNAAKTPSKAAERFINPSSA